ncbi:MAG: glycosyltransferase family 4 protein [Euryarchaeota archaeon]|nr:glycosyltransferase family 4 protein [Euryarchaeota archaeon]
MKVGLIIYDSIEQTTGGYLYDRMLLRELHWRGHDVDVFSINQSIRSEDNIRDQDTKLHSWMGEQDIVIQDGLCYQSLYEVNVSRECPVIALIHNLSSSLGQPTHSVEKSFLESVDGIICTSCATLKACQSLCSSIVHATVAYPGKDHIVSMPHIPHKSELRILHVGNIHPIKGLDVLLEALLDIKDIPFRLDIIGAISDESFYNSLEGLISNDIHDRVHFHGAVQMESMPKYYRQADVVAIPSRYEGFGIALLESMCFGVPVIASNNGGSEELVVHGLNGFLVPPDDHKAISQHIITLSDDALRTDMSYAAYLRWKVHPTWRDSMSMAIDFIEKL